MAALGQAGDAGALLLERFLLEQGEGGFHLGLCNRCLRVCRARTVKTTRDQRQPQHRQKKESMARESVFCQAGQAFVDRLFVIPTHCVYSEWLGRTRL